MVLCIGLRFSIGRRNLGIVASAAASSLIDQDDHVEDEGDENKSDAAEDPFGEDGQTCGVRGGRC